jgi:hypothetical protein
MAGKFPTAANQQKPKEKKNKNEKDNTKIVRPDDGRCRSERRIRWGSSAAISSLGRRMGFAGDKYRL